MTDAPDAVLARMRGDWDRRAAEDHKLHIATGHAGSEETFLASGLQDLEGIVLDGVVLAPSAETLEIGCGVGRLLLPLSRMVARAHGVDISTVMVEKSSAYTAANPNVDISLTDGELSRFADASLDFVFSFIVFQHIPDRGPIRRYVEEAARILKPGGVFRFQLDGRWWWRHDAGGPDTYNGLKFSTRDARELLAGTPFVIVDEWGADSHYYWITARKPGSDPAALVRPRSWDMPLLESLLGRLGSVSPEGEAADLCRGAVTLRPRVLELVGRLAAADDTTFVSEAYRELLGAESDDAGRAFHVEILKKGFEDRAALLDTITTGRGFLDLYRPHAPAVPWFVACEILMRLGLPPRPATFFELVALLVEAIAGRTDADAVRFSFQTVLGFEPDAAALAHHLGLLGSVASGRRLLVRDLLSKRRGPEEPGGPVRGDSMLPGESSPGEAARAVEILEEGAGLDDRAFVRLAYERILLREADTGGEAFYLGKLRNAEVSRAGTLREFLWSEEAQGLQTKRRGG